jgi:hypothetical protein
MNERTGWAARLGGAMALDVRSLAAFRIALGAVLLVDLANRARDFAAMYARDGIAPPELVRSRLATGEWSFHLGSDSTAVQITLLAVAAALATALVVGYRTRWATVGSFLLVASLHVRLPVVLNAGDTLLRVLVFWGCWLPLGAAWSLDARRRGPSPTPAVASFATFAFLVQLALVYWCAGLSKLNADWLDVDALGQTLAFGLYSQPLGRWLEQYPEATRWLSRAVVALELAGPCLLFVPWRTALFRVIAAAAFAAFHLGIAATITVGLFAWVGLAAWLAVLPSTFWDRIAAKSSHLSSAMSQPASPQPRRAAAATPACLFASLPLVASLALVTLWNALDLAGRDAAPRLHAALRPVANATMLRQSWKLFSDPADFDAWFTYRARLADGSIVDLFTGQPPLDDATPQAPQRFPNHRWRKLHLWLTDLDFAAYRQPVAEYMRRRWDSQHGDSKRVARLDFYCLRLPVHRKNSPNAFVRQTLATIVADPSQGNFAEALRELDK